ncbi:MAG: flagellar assembly protein T N-terminal domain-containing protein [Deltaproteobacteria bacterium]|nr:flagellar assembly protein T N-terminal domain-containing protein [Deltaproteobacteria bacterium]
MKKIILLLIVMILIFPLSSSNAQHKVRAEGMATIHKNFIDIARDKAVENAQRHAVEKIVGVMISSTSEVENYQLKLDRILSESQGFINDFRIVSEQRIQDQYQVVIEADVGTGRLKDRMTAINLVMVRKAKPRLMIIFSNHKVKDAVAEASMAKLFLSKGFRINDAEIIKKASDQQNLQKTLSDNREAAKIARACGAEIIISGCTEVTSRSFVISGIEMHSNKVVVSAKVINGDTGEVIATDSEMASAPGVKGDFKAVMEKAAESLARRLVMNVLERWSSELANAMTVNLVVSGLESYHDLLKLKELLPLEVKGIKEMFQRNYYDGQVELDIEINGTTQGLADDLAAIKINNGEIKVLEITQNRIKATIQ